MIEERLIREDLKSINLQERENWNVKEKKIEEPNCKNCMPFICEWYYSCPSYL